ANWDITGKSGGSAKIGYGGQNFDSNTRDDNNSTLFRVGTYWTPVEYSRFSLDLERDFALDTNTSSIRSFLNLGWRHTWSSRVATSANFILVDINSDDDTDDSTRETLSLEFIIKLRRWVDLNLIGKKTTNDANLDEYEYEKQWLGLGVTLRL
ncbi:MAG: outer membrane beta-barrel protein, partial [Gammaproteobacteria bacterium]|nr:outer membrane beta-barrel protein [Gammaproteobacteria bacterium]